MSRVPHLFRLRTAALCISMLIFSVAWLRAAAVEPVARLTVPLDTGWRFHLGDIPDAKAPAFDDASWRQVDLPHDWSIEGALNPPPKGDVEGGFFSHGIGWYRKTFSTTPAISSRQVVVEFDGVYMNGEVWINGHFLGRRPYGFIGFHYDLTDFLNKDGVPNVLAVRIDDSAEPSLRWYAGSGIYRHVRLVAAEFTHFRLDGGIRVTTPESGPDRAVVQVNAVIDAHFFSAEERAAWAADVWHAKPATRDVRWRCAVVGPDGSEITSAESTVTLRSMHPGEQAAQWLTVPKPDLWSAEAPRLYELRCTLSLDGRTLDEVTTTFGIRHFAFEPDRGLFVNGRPTKLKGVCLHQDGGSFGNAVPLGVWAWRLARLKEAGCNAVRTSHHPFAPEFYDLCDRLGLYVFDEAFDEWTRDWPYDDTDDPRGKSKYGYHLYFNQWHETDLRAMLRRDRNHPSVIMYSIGNEIPNQLDDDGWKMAKELVSICHEEDPTRPATSACDQSFYSSRNGFMDQLDLGGYNYIDRIYQDRTYAPEHERFPHRLFLGTETTHATRYWLGVRDLDYVVGDFIWTGIDYLGEAHEFPQRGSGSGILDLAGGRKPSFYQRAAYWRSDPQLQLLVFTRESPERPSRPAPALLSWNWPKGTELRVRAATNCDDVELLLNGRSLDRHPVGHDDYGSEWTVPYAPGALVAVGYRGGKQVATSELRTAGAPAKIQLAPQSLPIPSDLSIVEISLVDSAGTAVVGASSPVTVEVEEPGRLVGLDTGDLAYGGLFKTDTRPAYQGRLLATIERGAPGDIRMTVTSPGLPSATIRPP